MATLEGRLRDPEYRNWVKSTLCLQYMRDGLINFCDLKSQELKTKITQALPLTGNPPVYNLCPNVQFDFRRKSISCYCNKCNDILVEVKRYLTGIHNLNLKNADPKQLLHQHWQCSKLYMNEGQDVTSTTPKDTDISGLINFIDHCTVTRGCITNPVNLKQVRDTRNRVLHTSDMKITTNDFQNVITPLLIDLLEDPGFLLTDPDAITAVDMIKDVKKADFIITKDDEEKALYALKDEIKGVCELTRDEMSKLDDHVDTLCKDVSSLKQDELRVLQDGLTKNDIDISKVKQMYEALRTLIEQSNDRHGVKQQQLEEMQEQTKCIRESHKTLDCKFIAIQEQINKSRQDILNLSEEQSKLEKIQTKDRQEIKEEIRVIYKRQDDLSEEQTQLKKKQTKDRQQVKQEMTDIHQRQGDFSEELTKLKEKQTKDRQEVKQEMSNIHQRQDDLSEEQSQLKKKQTKDRQEVEQEMSDIHQRQDDLSGELNKLKEKQTKDREDMKQEMRNINQRQEEIRNKDKPHIPSEHDQLQLQEYLREAYTRAEKLDVTLLPEWGQLHVSEIFSPAILADDEELRSYKEIFYKDGKLQKRVVLLGEAGRGKSTFCKHLTDIWQGSTSVSQFCDIDVLKQFGYLFYVSCRFAEEKETVLNMITNQVLGGDDKMTVARYVLQYLPYLCLIIVDGLDEWAGSPTSCTGRMGDIAGMPGLAGVEDCVILITSRPWRFVSLSSHTQKIFMRLKIDGIKNVKELSQQVLHKLEDQEPAKSADEFLSQVEERNMSALMKNPLILIIALRGWVGDNDDETVRSLHKSMCINYINMIQTLIRRSEGQAGWPRPESKLRQLVPNFENLKSVWGQKSNELLHVFSQYKDVQRYAGLLLSVGQLAFDLLLGTEEQSLVFSKGKVKKYLPADDENDESINVCLAFGIISKTETTTRGLKKLESYAFCHKTFQEFFAALWLASKYQTVKTKLFKCIKTVINLQGFEILIRFLCGLDSGIGKDVWMFVTEEVEFVEEMYEWQMRRFRKLEEMNEKQRMHLGKVEEKYERQKRRQWEQVQRLACTCMKENEMDPKDQKSGQIYFCIPHIKINAYTSEEDIMLLCHVMEEYYSNVKSVNVWHCESQQQVQLIFKSISSCSGLQNIELSSSGEHGSTVLDLQKHNKLEKLELQMISVEDLMLPVAGATITSLKLDNVTMTDRGLKQLGQSLSSCSSLVEMDFYKVRCRDHVNCICIPILDLQKHNKLETLKLKDISVEGLLIHMEGADITSLSLDRVTMTHQGLIQLGQSLSSCFSLVEMKFNLVRCSEHDHNVCTSVLDQQKHSKLENLELTNISIEGLLLPLEGAAITSLKLDRVSMTHHGLIQLGHSLSSCSSLVEMDFNLLTCSEHVDTVCIPVLDLLKHKKLERLKMRDVSADGLLLTAEGATITSLALDNVTMTHNGSKQLVGFLSSCCRQMELSSYKVTCSKQSDNVCFSFLNLQTQDMLEGKRPEILPVTGHLRPLKEVNNTSLQLHNITMSQQRWKNLWESLTYSTNLLKLELWQVTCSDNCIVIAVLDLQMHNTLEELELKYLSVDGLLPPKEGATITLLKLRNVAMTHHGLEQLNETLSSCISLEEVNLNEVKCSEHANGVCIPVLDLCKHNKLKRLKLWNISFEGLQLPEEGTTVTSLKLFKITITHHGVKKLVKSLSFCISIVHLYLYKLSCSVHADCVCMPVLDLQEHNKLEKLRLKKMSVDGLLLSMERATIQFLELSSVTLTHNGLEQLMKSLLSCSRPAKFNLRTVTCSEHTDSVCIPVLCLQNSHNLRKLELNDISAEYLSLPVDCARTTSVKLCTVILSHDGLKHFGVTSFSLLEDLQLKNVECNEHGNGVCIPYLDLRKQNNLKQLILDDVSVEGLLLPEEGISITSLGLCDLTITHHSLEQVVKCVSLCPGLEELVVWKVKCIGHDETKCIPVLDIQKHNNLKTLVLDTRSVESLMLPDGKTTITLLGLYNLTITHHSLEQVVKFVSLCPGLEELDVQKVKCVEHNDTVCIPILDLQKHIKLKRLVLDTISVECLLLPEREATTTLLALFNLIITHLNDINDICVQHLPLPVDCAITTSLKLCNVIVSHNGLKQLGETSFSLLEDLHLKNVECREHGICVCTPYLDLRKQNNLKHLILDNIPVEGLMLPEESATITSLILYNLRMAHNSLEQVVKFVSFCPGLKELDAQKVKCVEHGDTLCIPVLDLQKHNNLKRLVLNSIYVEGMLLPEEGATITSLWLSKVTMPHDLKQLLKSISTYSNLVQLHVCSVRFSDHDNSTCPPVMDLRKLTKLQKLLLYDISVEGLLLPEDAANITSLELDNVTMTHDGMEQLVKSLKSCTSLGEMNIDSVRCSDHVDSVCIAVLDLTKHNSQGADIC